MLGFYARISRYIGRAGYERATIDARSPAHATIAAAAGISICRLLAIIRQSVHRTLYLQWRRYARARQIE